MDETAGDGTVRTYGELTSRRQWLRSASGLLVAAGGLIAPVGREDATAGDAHHRRHQQRRRQRQRRREDHGRGGTGFKDIAFDVTNELDTLAYGDFWYRYNNPWWPAPGGVGAHSQQTFSHKGSDNAAIVPFYRYYIQANNPYLGTPWVTLAWGGVMGKGGWSGGTTVVSEKTLSENESTEMVVEGYRFFVQRTADDNDFKRFKVLIQKA
jgi:hypothetical protein